ncbi:Polypyrimidine tract-binding protein-like 2 [Vitis vinifera]|uniref:Polypyrimidine tract-binding protein-like 2 n=1 Tax=Vitis vinifera TaxID=29760 RepID=A0A438CU45_VITVI|nr:Polypyrimidine tract-binding protein-like 2 [Vitis vinifera]
MLKPFVLVVLFVFVRILLYGAVAIGIVVGWKDFLTKCDAQGSKGLHISAVSFNQLGLLYGMASVSSQPQFRYTQPPSKVLHLRNLPWECTEEELIELGKPFDLNQAIAMISYYASSSEPAQVRGKTVYLQYSNRQEIVNNKTSADVAGNVLLVTIEGADARLVSIDVLHLVSKLHAFLLTIMGGPCHSNIFDGSLMHWEKGHMCVCLLSPFLNTDSFFPTLPPSSSPYHSKSLGCFDFFALVHPSPFHTACSVPECHTCSTHTYITNQKGTVMSIIRKEGEEFLVDNWKVFSAFGFVHKITTFEKTAGFQALVQFSDSETASAAKNALDGRSIPRYLLPEHLGPCTLRITFSAHTDLSVKFQSHRSRDYTNPYLPVASSAIDGSGQFSMGFDGRKVEPESNVLLASIENMQYAVTLDVLHMVFSAFGPIQKIAMFDKNGGVQALIQYPDVQTAIVAKEALEGHCIYDGGFCKLHISYSRHTDLSIKNS